MNTTALLIVGLPLLCILIIVFASMGLVSTSLSESNRKKEVWPKFARMIGGTLTEDAGAQSVIIDAHFGEDPFHLDTYVYGANHVVLNCTRMRAFYRALAPFELAVCSRSMLDEAQVNPKLHQVDGSSLGLSPDFVAYGSDMDQMRMLLDTEFVRIIDAAAPIDLRIRRRRNWKNQGTSNSIYEVHAQKYDVVTDLTQLTAMHLLVSSCIQKLHDMHIAGRLVEDTHPELDYFNTDGTNVA
jgi:hypothetical protein